ncbi:heme lyase NrfEFG subunit NrfE [Vibrio ponticus]|uniref:Heme lyase NrfEFG subunit NrfE n=1 Tax=Vibrio ponticus TaxID=265668 RepID=A0A3N3E4G9_9VIBR|nr:heme lyase NrfEFG subunit NrfE [Vibrio ponticus]ROV58781.1 heme lyase NrfEFG subunit NrfE [Vibrio ponticus]ROV61626.1 heme lyase NrfEFG subunit NrfE [Vibrio ponticus]
MMGELGHFALIWVVVSSSLAAVYYAWCRHFSHARQLSLCLLSRLNCVIASLSLICLVTLFWQDQFQYHYVATHSNIALPDYFKVAAVWGGHQGSMLFWVFTLTLWSALISLNHQRYRPLIDDVLWIMTWFIAAFGWFTLLASNPFEFSTQVILQGRDLNPMLQDIGLIFHPPLLYLGYIGFSTVFAFALAALVNPRLSTQWVALCLPWAISAWLFLSVGILLGSWWAYNELGWGGWWFWDPVENASLLPWLTGTALLHAMVAVRRHKQMQLWALILALVTFCLSILGTFIVRSGILTSVHAFAVDPGKGIALLGILAATLLVGFVLLLKRSEGIKSPMIEALIGRSYFVLLSLGLLSVASLTVLLGTFYPMVYQLLGFGQVSVGAPYFNTLFFPLTAFALMGIGMVPYLKWHQGTNVGWRRIAMRFFSALALGAVLYSLQVNQINIGVAVIWGLGVWVVIGHLVGGIRQRKASFMLCAHIGVAIAAIGAMMNAQHSYELNQKMAPGIQTEFTHWYVDYLDTHWYVGANYTAQQAEIKFSQGGTEFVLRPERRHYPVRVMNMSEPAIYSAWNGDYYVTLGPKVAVGAYAIKIQFRAYIGWVWFGGLLACLGAILTLALKVSSKEWQGVFQQT